jgi:phosphoglycerate dehydrogenase-like enzyme
MTLRVHINHERLKEQLDQIREKLDDSIQVTTGPDLPAQADYHVLVDGNPSKEELAASPDLRALVVPWAGVSEAVREMILQYPQVSIYNLHHNAAPTAETAMALLLSAAKFIIPFDQALRRNNWSIRYEPNPSVLLLGKTALVLGYGEIGQHIARVCQAFGMQVWGVHKHAVPNRQTIPGIPEFPVEALRKLLPDTHVLMLSLPLTPETKGLIGELELKLMPPGGLLVNVGRGPVVEQKALFEALRDGHLCAAGLDVWYNYPKDDSAYKNTPPADYPFGDLENLVMSPHRGGQGGTEEVEVMRMNQLAELLNALAHGENGPHKVNLHQGY